MARDLRKTGTRMRYQERWLRAGSWSFRCQIQPRLGVLVGRHRLRNPLRWEETGTTMLYQERWLRVELVEFWVSGLECHV